MRIALEFSRLLVSRNDFFFMTFLHICYAFNGFGGYLDQSTSRCSPSRFDALCCIFCFVLLSWHSSGRRASPSRFGIMVSWVSEDGSIWFWMSVLILQPWLRHIARQLLELRFMFVFGPGVFMVPSR